MQGNTDGFVTVPVLVPKERLADFYASLAEFMGGEASRATSMSAEATDDADPRQPWGTGDDALALEVVQAANDHARAVYRLLATNAGTPVPYTEIDAAGSMDGARRTGLLGSMGRTCGHRLRYKPWTWDPEHGTYTMPADIAPMFLAALERV